MNFQIWVLKVFVSIHFQGNSNFQFESIYINGVAKVDSV